MNLGNSEQCAEFSFVVYWEPRISGFAKSFTHFVSDLTSLSFKKKKIHVELQSEEGIAGVVNKTAAKPQIVAAKM